MKIINHCSLTRTYGIRPELKLYNPLDLEDISGYESTHIGELFNNFIYGLGVLVETDAPYDRLGRDNNLNVDFDPIPKIPNNWNREFGDICDQRAQELWALGKPIRCWWSGGIDSTTTLTALIRTKKPEDTLSIWMSKQSVEENPTYYEKIKNLNIEWATKETLLAKKSLWNGKVLNVNGECGDPMYGTFVIEKHIEELDDHWHTFLDFEDVNFIYKDSPMRGRFMDYLEEHITHCPFEIKNPFDIAWWLAFTTKWQWIERRWFGFLEDPSGYKNLVAFFNDPEFQIWSMTNHHLKHKGTYKTYKWPSKKYIYDFNPDSNYLMNKTKEKSLPKTMGSFKTFPFRNQNRVVFDNGDYYPFGDDGEIFPIMPTDVPKWDLFNKPVWDRYKTMEPIRINS